jgi:hypothetical protein
MVLVSHQFGPYKLITVPLIMSKINDVAERKPKE